MDEIDRIIENAYDVNIVLNAVNAHGKTSSLRTIIARLKEKSRENHKKVIIKIFDISQAWFHNAPVKYRQRITPEVLVENRFRNINDCVYEIGELPPEFRRYFIAVIIGQDYKSRKATGYQYGLETVEDLPKIFYVFEEAANYFGSWSLKKKDDYAPILYDFITVGRNYGLRSFLVVNREIGSLSTDIRDISPKILGHVEAKSDLTYYKSKSKELYKQVKAMPKYHWIYSYRENHGPFRIEDTVNHVPEDYVWMEPRAQVKKEPMKIPYWIIVFFLLLVMFLLGVYIGTPRYPNAYM